MLPLLSLLDLLEIFPSITEAVSQRKSFDTSDSSGCFFADTSID